MNRKYFLSIMSKNKYKLYTFCFILFTFSLFTSCIPQKKLIYLQNKAGSNSTSQEFNNPMKYYKVKPGDELYFKVIGLDEKTMSLFAEKQQGIQQFQQQSMYFQSLTVNDSGLVSLPTIGLISVKGRTIDDIQIEVQKKLNEFVNFGAVSIKLANFRVSVLGEVENPSSYFISDDITTLFEVLSLAGDMTPYGNREEVNIVRQTEKGLTYNTIDLTSRDFLNSEFYYLYPGDVVYIPQLAGKAFGLASFQWGTLLSIISTTLSAVSIIIYLNKP
jgi:polysaccharide biosynthesis/export protein